MTRPITDEELVAFLHGELDDERAMVVEEALNADAALAERAVTLDSQDEMLRRAFAPIMDAPVPDAMRTAVTEPRAADVVSLEAFRNRKVNAPTRGWGWPQFGAMAASLAIGLIVGPALLGGGGNADALIVASADGPTVPAAVATMLNTAPSGTEVALGSLGTGQVDLSFRTADETLCRQLQVRQGAATSDLLACRSRDSWRVEALGQREAANGGMRTASGDAAAAVVAAVDAVIASDPLVGEAEQAALRR